MKVFRQIDGAKPPSQGLENGWRPWLKIQFPGLLVTDVAWEKTGVLDLMTVPASPMRHCHWYDTAGCRLAPGDHLYHSRGGLKLEPQSSEDAAPWHWDWRYPDPYENYPAVRAAKCGH